MSVLEDPADRDAVHILTVDSSSKTERAPMVPSPMTIFLRLTGGCGVENIVLVMYG
jgi:hypothetical protein